MIDKLKRIVSSRELLLYAVFGVLTSVLNVALFAALLAVGCQYLIANIITLVVVKAAAYICNKLFVFRSHCDGLSALLSEIGRYVVTRGATMLVDFFGLMLLVEAFHADEVVSKVIVTLVVIALNYVMSKTVVYKDVVADDGADSAWSRLR